MDREWMYLADRSSNEFKYGVELFIRKARESQCYNDPRCPCRQCKNNRTQTSDTIKKHLFQHGFTDDYERWIFHCEELVGEGTDTPEGISVNNKRKRSSSVVEIDSRAKPNKDSPLFPGEEKMRALELSAKILRLRAKNDWSHESFGSTVRFLRSSFPEGSVGNLPASVEEAKEFLRELGFGYEMIHACKYDCALFWKENSSLDKCPTCDEPRFRYEDESTGEKIPQKVMYYFPLKPRLQRLFMSEKTAKDMRWHKEKRAEVKGLMSHPADSPQWKCFDEEYPWFAKDSRNIRLGLATKGIKLSGNSCSMWPVTLVPYNLPPEKCTSGEFFMMTLLIPGPESPGFEIDVYLRPLIDELKELWNDGVGTHDASTGETFLLHASLLWTISDFPTYESLSGWCLGGFDSCPTCHHETSVLQLKGGKKIFGFKNRKAYLGHRRFLPPDHPWREIEDYRKNWVPEKEEPPKIHAGDFLLRQVESVRRNTPGKNPNNEDRVLRQNFMNNWIKKSVFFELDYWHNLAIRHNIDIMYIEQSLCDNIIGTLLDIQGMTKDSKRDRLDLAQLGIRSELHFQFLGNSLVKPPACYTLPKQNRTNFCGFFKAVKLPGPFGIDLSEKVNVRSERIWGLKAHECHVVLQRLLPIAALRYVRKDIVTTFSELANFFQRMCSKTLRPKDLERLEERVALIYCKLEKIYPPSFFDIITHSALHLPLHAKLTGPVEFRSMYPFEREMEKLGKYVKNRTRPEESIAQAYSANEALRFCSIYHSNEEEEIAKPSLSVFKQNAQPFELQKCAMISETELGRVSSYVLRNCKELEPYLKEYNEELKKKSSDKGEENEEEKDEEGSNEDGFPFWFEDRINKLRKNEPEKITEELNSLAKGPQTKANVYSGCVVDGIRFLTEEEDKDRIDQSRGVYWLKDRNGKKEDFYGHLSSVLEVKFESGFRVILFMCKWIEPRYLKKDCNISILNSFAPVELCGHKESYLLATQATMAFYPNVGYGPNIGYGNIYLQKLQPRLFWDAIETIGEGNYERAGAARPGDCNFEWTEKVGEIENGQLLCKSSPAQVMNSNVLPISIHEFDDVSDKAKMFESVYDEYYSFEENDDDSDDSEFNDDDSFKLQYDALE